MLQVVTPTELQSPKLYPTSRLQSLLEGNRLRLLSRVTR